MLCSNHARLPLWGCGEYDLKCYALCRRPLLAPRVEQKLLFGRPGASILAPWGTVLVPCGHPGEPWEQQEGLVGVRSQIFSDFGMLYQIIKHAGIEACDGHRMQNENEARHLDAK